MEEPTYDYDWRNPITVSNGSFEWFKHWLNDNCNYKQIAEHFNTSESAVQNIASLFKWKERRKNKEHYESWKREQLTEKRYTELLERAYKDKIKEWDIQETLVTVALIKAGIIANANNIQIPEDEIPFKDLARVIQNGPKATGQILDDLYRALGKPPKINDNQNHKIDADIEVSTRFKKIFNQDRLNERYKK